MKIFISSGSIPKNKYLLGFILSLIVLILIQVSPAFGVEYACPAFKKVESNSDYSKESLEKGQFTTRLKEENTGAILSRCSYAPSEKKVTCDDYKVDKIQEDTSVHIKKYYVFHQQFDFQIFGDLTSIENNGRGGIQYGKCSVVAP